MKDSRVSYDKMSKADRWLAEFFWDSFWGGQVINPILALLVIRIVMQVSFTAIDILFAVLWSR